MPLSDVCFGRAPSGKQEGCLHDSCPLIHPFR
jgi:hypothetical protein